MIQLDLKIDIEKWLTFRRDIFEPYIKEKITNLLNQNKIDQNNVLFRGGFEKKKI